MKLKIDALWDDKPVDVTAEVNFIWSIANKLRGPYQPDKYKDVIIPMVIIRRFECALEPYIKAVFDYVEKNPDPAEQKEIAEYLDKKCAAIDAAKEKCRVQLEKLAEYKKSLIYEYVTGKREVA